MNIRGEHGFTLIELLITVVIIGILAAIALPSYQQSATKSRRSDGQALLMEVAQREERFFTENLLYTSSMTALGLTTDPAASPEKNYQTAILTPAAAVTVLQITDPTITACPIATCFVAVATPCLSTTCTTTTATPQGRQQSDGRLAITSTGQKFWDRNNDGDYADTNENNWN